MRTKEQLDLLNAKISDAILAYRLAIKENLGELGHPVSVQGEDDDTLGINVDVMSDNEIFHYTIDQIKYDGTMEQVHYSRLNYEDADDWMYLCELGDATDYVLEAIQWIDRDKLMEVDGDVWSGTANEVYSFCSCEIDLFFIHKNGRIESVFWHKSIDDFIGIPGVFAVEKTQYETAIRQIEQHEQEIAD